MNKSIDIAQDFDHYGERDRETLMMSTKEDFIGGCCLNGKVVLYPMYEYSEDECGFACGPQTDEEALSDTATIDDTLKALVKDTPYENAIDVGVAENDHAIMVDQLPQGKNASDAYEFVKQKLMEFDNVVIGE
jgi:hypothetical protein